MEPFQFNVAGRADLTQKWSRAVIKQSYDTAPHGVPGMRVGAGKLILEPHFFVSLSDTGNDDYGALSSWLVFAMLGFYPLAGTNRYFLGSPVSLVDAIVWSGSI